MQHFLSRFKLAHKSRESYTAQHAVVSVDDSFIGISKSGKHAFVFANPVASLTAFPGF